MIFDGTLTVCELVNNGERGLMPRYVLRSKSVHYYGNRTIGYGRQYAAMGVDQRIDRLVRIWRDNTVNVHDYVLLDDGHQYRIDMVQHLQDDDGMNVTDLTLYRWEDNYEVDATAIT